jgi:flagellar L-ring protein precursor FlgH
MDGETTMKTQIITKTLLSFTCLVSLSACSATMDRLKSVGQDPPMAYVENPTQRQGYQPVTLPMPDRRVEEQQANSLWMSGRKSFFKDQRASQVGDIMTVLVDIKDNATLENKTQKTKAGADSVGIPNFLGLESKVASVLPGAPSASALIGANSTVNDTGHGKIERTEDVQLKVAAVITQILPNGNMVIHGRQQVRVSNERRDLEVAGIIRPEDISTGNTIGYEKIAEARIAYGGQGMLTDANRPRYGSEVVDILSPF